MAYNKFNIDYFTQLLEGYTEKKFNPNNDEKAIDMMWEFINWCEWDFYEPDEEGVSMADIWALEEWLGDVYEDCGFWDDMEKFFF